MTSLNNSNHQALNESETKKRGNDHIMSALNPPHSQSQLVIYQTENGVTKLDARFENETIWLSQMQMAELFQTSVSNFNCCRKNDSLDHDQNQADSPCLI